MTIYLRKRYEPNARPFIIHATAITRELWLTTEGAYLKSQYERISRCQFLAAELTAREAEPEGEVVHA